jgi:hypothetical protein
LIVERNVSTARFAAVLVGNCSMVPTTTFR